MHQLHDGLSTILLICLLGILSYYQLSTIMAYKETMILAEDSTLMILADWQYTTHHFDVYSSLGQVG